jgi:hypothetical protein
METAAVGDQSGQRGESVVVLIVKGFESVRGVVNRLMTLQDPEILRSLNRTTEERKYGYSTCLLST